MTTFNKSSLKLLFEQGDVPTGQNYSDLIDSQVNLVETTAQSMAGALVTTELNSPLVSASVGNFTTSVSAGTATFASLVVRGAGVYQGPSTFTGGITTTSAVSMINGLSFVGAQTIDNTSGTINALTGNITNIAATTITATTIGVTGDVSANAIKVGVGVVSAAGTAQATAALLTSTINRGKGVTDGSTTGFRPPANSTGLIQYLYNEGASANLWPPTGGFINGLPVNTAFPLVASAAYTILHITASSYAVK